MSKPCECQLPTIRMRVHSPAFELRKHKDFVSTLKEPTDSELFTHATIALLKGLGYAHIAPFVVGFFLDLINQLPTTVRDPLAAGIILGLGMEVNTENEVTISNVPRYEPLSWSKDLPPPAAPEKVPGFVESAGGLLLPKGALYEAR